MLNARSQALLCLLFVLAFCLPASAAADRVTCYTLWDESFLYLAIEVQDPDVEGTNAAHMSSPWEDDAIEVFLDRDGTKAKTRVAGTYQMSVSAAGGSSWLIGADGQATPKPIFTFKYSKTIQGTINRPDDKDIGYIIEMAMPWREMGGIPKPGEKMGFNVVCRLKGETDGFVSLSQQVKTAEDIQVPALWGAIKMVDAPTIIAFENGAVVCRKVLQRAPTVNGQISANEWIRDMRFQIVKPELPKYTPKAPKFTIERLSLVHYLLDDNIIRNENGASTLTNHPFDGTGPWYSPNRVKWHKNQLTGIKDAGIDVVMPVYSGDESQNNALRSMIQALKELKSEGKSYPLIGMYGNLLAKYKPGDMIPDQNTLYKPIRDFFLNVPQEFRVSVQLPEEKGGHSAYIIDAAGAFDMDGSNQTFIDFCNQKFAEDFGGKLIWIGNSGSKARGVTLDGHTDIITEVSLKADDAEWIRTANVKPTAPAKPAGQSEVILAGSPAYQIWSRMDGKVYEEDWNNKLSKNPDWLIIDGWNDIVSGGEICSTFEYGKRYIGLTRVNMLKFNGAKNYDAKYLKHNTPSTMLPGMLYQVNLTIKNAGMKPWYPGVQGVYLAGRWYKDGVLFSDTGVRLPLQETVLSANSITKMVGIRTVDADGNPLPEGNYELRWDLTLARDNWFGNNGDVPLRVPVKIGTPAADGFTLVSSTAPTSMKAGAVYDVNIKVRNDGPAAWKAGTTLAYSWHNTADGSVSQQSGTPLQGDVEPGRTVELTISVTAPQTLSSYLLKWDVVTETKSLASGIGYASEPVTVAAEECGAAFIASDAPNEMAAGKNQKVALTVANNSAAPWSKGELSVGYRWFYLDGIEAASGTAKTSIPAVKPGMQVIVKTGVTPPPYDGQYYLVWEFFKGNNPVSLGMRGEDQLISLVTVNKGKLVTADLTKLYDTDVTSFERLLTDGDADGTGLTLPAEFLPPLVTMGVPETKLWPSGLWNVAKGTGLESNRHISFKYPSKADGVKNAVACKGQAVPVTSGKYTEIHILAFSTKDASGAFDIGYKGKKSSADVKFSSWDAAPKNGELPGFVCLHRHSPQGDQPGQACYINDYMLKVDPTAELNTITLPNNPDVKIIAITLKKA